MTTLPISQPSMLSRARAPFEAAIDRARLTVVPNRRRIRAPRMPFVTLVSVVLLGGVIGALLCAWTIAHAGSRWPLVLCSIGGAASAVWLMGVDASRHTGWLIVGLGLHGLFVNAVQSTMYALCAYIYPTAVRATGTASALVNVARMTGATLGIAVLGTLFAAAHGGAAGLRAAMFAGAAVQLAGAAVSALSMQSARLAA